MKPFDRKRITILLSLTLLWICVAPAMAAAPFDKSGAGPLYAGAAKLDITPASLLGINPMGGAFKGVHDPIFLRALILDNGINTVALISAEVIEAGDMTPIRRRIEKELGIPFDHVIITATHDHSAPRIGEVSPGSLAHALTPEGKKYTAVVFDKIIAVLKQARASRQPARFGIGKGSVDININRDEYTADGWKIGENPDGPSDKTLWVMKFESLTGRPIALLINYAVHSTVTLGTNRVSGDLGGAASRYVEEALGGVALWTPGALGDQNPRVALLNSGKDPKKDPEFAFAAMDAQGLMAGSETVRVTEHIQKMASTVCLQAQERVIACPTKPGVGQMADVAQVQVPSVNLRLGLIMIDQVALAGVSGEVVSRISDHLKKTSPLSDTILISIANDRIGYLADDAAYDRPIFEVNESPVARGYAETSIVDGLVDMILAHL